jgi:hypothetical protein
MKSCLLGYDGTQSAESQNDISQEHVTSAFRIKNNKPERKQRGALKHWFASDRLHGTACQKTEYQPTTKADRYLFAGTSNCNIVKNDHEYMRSGILMSFNDYA